MVLAEKPVALQEAAAEVGDILSTSGEPTPEMRREAVGQIASLVEQGLVDAATAELLLRDVLVAGVTQDVLALLNDALSVGFRRRRRLATR
jgi:hypothetical protein